MALRRHASADARRPRPARGLPGDATRASRATARRAASSRSCACSTARDERRAHDEPRDGRPRRLHLRADDEPRARRGRLPPGPRPAPEQHARRGRPDQRAARAGLADGEHDVAEPRARRRRARAARSAAAGGTRLRTRARAGAASLLDEGLSVAEAVDRPRVHPSAGVVHVEPGVDERASALERPAVGAPLAGAAPLLRRRERDHADRVRRVTHVGAVRQRVSLTGIGDQPR